VDAALTGIEAKHDFAQAQAIPTAGRIGNEDRVHRRASIVQVQIIVFPRGWTQRLWQLAQVSDKMKMCLFEM
jgi:hypothetical protein